MKKSCLFLVILASLSIHAKTILHIGDSHSAGNFGKELSRLMNETNNIQSASYGSCGSVAAWFFNGKATTCGFIHYDHLGNRNSGTQAATPLIENLVENFPADIAIIQLGGNYGGYSNEFILKDTLKVAKFVTDRGMKCLWVGTPDSRTNQERRNEVRTLIKENVEHLCEFFDSSIHTKYPATGGDGIHYYGTEGTAQAKAWAKKVFDIVNQY